MFFVYLEALFCQMIYENNFISTSRASRGADAKNNFTSDVSYAKRDLSNPTTYQAD